MIVVTLLLCLFTSSVLGSTTCKSTGECWGDTINDGYVYCYGYKGCYDAEITSTTWLYCEGYFSCAYGDILAVDVSCDGSYGCYNALLDIDDDLYCDGDYGCYSSTIAVADNLYCDGSYGCLYADIEVIDYIYCAGLYGCSRADVAFPDGGSKLYSGGAAGGYYLDLDTDDDISGTNYVYAMSLYSLYYANLYSGESNNYYFYFYGYKSGYQVDVYCEKGSTCELSCFGYGCYYTTIYCDDDDTTTCTTKCSLGSSDTYCVTETSYSSVDTMTSIKKYRKKSKLLDSGSKNGIIETDLKLLDNAENEIEYKKHIELGLPTFLPEMEEERRNDKKQSLKHKLKQVKSFETMRKKGDRRDKKSSNSNNNNNNKTPHKKSTDGEVVLTSFFNNSHHILSKHNGIYLGIGLILGLVVMGLYFITKTTKSVMSNTELQPLL